MDIYRICEYVDVYHVWSLLKVYISYMYYLMIKRLGALQPACAYKER